MMFDGVGTRRRKERNDRDALLSEWRVEEGNDKGRDGRRVLIISGEDGGAWTNGWERAYLNVSESGAQTDIHC